MLTLLPAVKIATPKPILAPFRAPFFPSASAPIVAPLAVLLTVSPALPGHPFAEEIY